MRANAGRVISVPRFWMSSLARATLLGTNVNERMRVGLPMGPHLQEVNPSKPRWVAGPH